MIPKSGTIIPKLSTIMLKMSTRRIPSLISAQRGFMMYAALGAVLVIAALGIALKVQTARLNSAKADLEACTTRYGEALRQIDRQNAGVKKVEESAKKAARNAAAALEKARAAQASSEAERKRLEGLKSNSGNCQDALKEVRKGLK